MKKFMYLIWMLLLISSITQAQKKVRLSEALYEKAVKYFAEAKKLSDQDSGQLWGKPLYGPMMFIKFPERILVANEPDAEGYLQPQGKLYVGALTNQVGIANTAQQWNGKKWTTVIWFRFSPKTRTTLFMHELYHRIQPEPFFRGKTNVHLDEKEARVLIRLEWNALFTAYSKSNLPKASKDAMRDLKSALVYRAYRHLLYPESWRNEVALQMNEGLAEYTGIKLSGLNEEETHKALSRSITNSTKRRSFVRSFAYISGPLYGLLLDRYAPGWRKKLKESQGLAEMLAQNLDIELPKDKKALQNIFEKWEYRYENKNIRQSEEARDQKRRQQEKMYRANLVDGQTFRINLSKNFRYNFDPNTLFPLKKHGVVYPTITVRDNWGILKVNNGGALMSSDKSYIVVPGEAKLNQATNKVEAKGWKLELKQGWKIVKEGKHWVLKSR
ncbi:MAG TPA: hypothetical protein DCS93_36345 [Microscillaceae bacterium]|nr:hypothetical protein [Microscillaceae bacterium]